MKILKLCLVFSLLVSNQLMSNLHAKSPSKLSINASQSGHSPSELMTFFNQYLKEYNDYLSSAKGQERKFSATHFYSPTFQIPPKGKPRVSEPETSLANGLTQFLKGLQAEGIVRIEWRSMNVESLGPTKAIATNRAVGIKADGKVQREMATIYFLHKEEGKWKIAVISPYSPKVKLRFES